MTPQRTCIGCRCVAAQAELLRLVMDPPTRAVVVDAERRRPGRGAYLHPRTECVAAAVRRRAVTRALRAPDANVATLPALVAAYAKAEGKA